MPSSSGPWPPEDELRERLTVVEPVVESFPETRAFEHLLGDLTDRLGSGRLPRSTSLPILTDWISTEPWAYGAEDALDFAMRQLQWPEMRAALEEMRRSASLRIQGNLSRVLEVYDASWPGGEIYRTYDAQ